MTNQTAFALALIGYICATALALAYLVRRDEMIHRLASLATLAGWACHTLGLVALAIETGRPPLGNLTEAVSAAVWVAVLLEMWLERRHGLKVLGAFVLPVILLLGIKGMATRVGPDTIGPALASAWIWVHIALALIGIAAFVLNFAGAIMYLLQEHQLKARRPGTFYYRLPDLETLDRLTYRTLVLGFPVPHRGPAPRRGVGALGLGQRLRLRSARPLLAAGLGHLRGHPGRPGDGNLAGTPRGVLRHRRLRHAHPHPGRGRPVPRPARLLT